VLEHAALSGQANDFLTCVPYPTDSTYPGLFSFSAIKSITLVMPKTNLSQALFCEDIYVMDHLLNREEKPSSVRKLRRVVETVLPFVGVLIVVGAVFVLRDLRWQMALVVGGLLLLEIGVWKCAQRILPSERKFDALRFEAEMFIGLVRQLNTSALLLKDDPSPEHQQAFDDIRGAMLQAVERISDVAGKTDAEIAEAIANTVTQAEYPDADSRKLS
jgi:hypothetical protein